MQKRLKDKEVVVRRITSMSQWHLIQSWSAVAVSRLIAQCFLWPWLWGKKIIPRGVLLT